MSAIESIIYGFVSGLAEFMPVSPQAHQSILMRLFGLSVREPIRDMLVHIAILIALVTTCRTLFSHFKISSRTHNRHNRRVAPRQEIYDIRLAKTAVFPLLIGLLFYFTTRKLETNHLVLVLFLILNGIIIIIPEYARHGNKDARFMSGGDAVIIGLLGAASIFPGISRIAAIDSYTTLRGVSRTNSINWLFLLSVPVLVIWIFIDLILLFILPIAKITFISFLHYLLSALSAYFGGYLSIALMRYLSVHTGYSAFAYYSWGAAMLTFVLYLIA